jgi:S-adenosylmethionine:tRNA ribosyltransferase-isomerase
VLSGLSFPSTRDDGTTCCDAKIQNIGQTLKLLFLELDYLQPAMKNINIADYDYELPVDRIAQYPVADRDASKLLVFDGNNISSDIFRNLDRFIPDDSLLVFNNTRVIRARLLFKKKSGAGIEILCLEPLFPPSYEMSFASGSPVEWKCIIGNLKKWKNGALSLKFFLEGKEDELSAERICAEGEAWRIRFSWNDRNLTFSEVIEASGHTPLPPYITREDETEDSERYQTIYSVVKGSVAAPTAGLHFSEDVLRILAEKGIKRTDITLHVGAGTFKPVKATNLSEHDMHSEHFFVTNDTIGDLIKNNGRIIAVGTTSVRALESLYWLGVKASDNNTLDIANMSVEQWEPYQTDPGIDVKTSLTALKALMRMNNIAVLNASTRIIIVPGYQFRLIKGMVTNFHQPRSTLLLLISAWTGKSWQKIYKYALENEFRFLSYGDSSLLFSSLF